MAFHYNDQSDRIVTTATMTTSPHSAQAAVNAITSSTPQPQPRSTHDDFVGVASSAECPSTSSPMAIPRPLLDHGTLSVPSATYDAWAAADTGSSFGIAPGASADHTLTSSPMANISPLATTRAVTTPSTIYAPFCSSEELVRQQLHAQFAANCNNLKLNGASMCPLTNAAAVPQRALTPFLQAFARDQRQRQQTQVQGQWRGQPLHQHQQQQQQQQQQPCWQQSIWLRRAQIQRLRSLSARQSGARPRPGLQSCQPYQAQKQLSLHGAQQHQRQQSRRGYPTTGTNATMATAAFRNPSASTLVYKMRRQHYPRYEEQQGFVPMYQTAQQQHPQPMQQQQNYQNPQPLPIPHPIINPRGKKRLRPADGSGDSGSMSKGERVRRFKCRKMQREGVARPSPLRFTVDGGGCEGGQGREGEGERSVEGDAEGAKGGEGADGDGHGEREGVDLVNVRRE